MLARTDLPAVDIRGPKAPPLIGPMGGVLRFFADPVQEMLTLHRTYGDVATVSDKNAALVCAFGAAHNQHVMTSTSTFEHLSEIPVRPRPGSAFARMSNTVIFKNGEAHRLRRRQIMPAFSKSAVDGYAPQIVEVADALVSRWPTGDVIDIAPLLRDLTAGVALRCLFGLRVDDAGELGRISVEILSTIAHPLAMLLPLQLPGTPYRKGHVLAEQIDKRIRALIALKRQDPQGTDALSRLIHAKDEEGAPLSDDELVSESNTLFSAGFDTSAHTLAWTLFLLAARPRVLDDVVAELDDVLRGAPPSPEHLPSLVHLDRALKESMRLLPVAVLLFMRVVAEEGAKLGGVALPKGAQLTLSPLVTHRDPHLFPAPLRFSPARWERVEPSIFEYMPFGGGARMCIGASFATLALRLMLARILQSVRPSLPSGARVDYAVRGPAMGPKGGLRLRLETPARSSPPLIERPRGTITRLVEIG